MDRFIVTAPIFIHMLVLRSNQTITTSRTFNQPGQQTHTLRFIHLFIVGRSRFPLCPDLLPQIFWYYCFMDSINLNYVFWFPLHTFQICPSVVKQLSVICWVIQNKSLLANG